MKPAKKNPVLAYEIETPLGPRSVASVVERMQRQGADPILIDRWLQGIEAGLTARQKNRQAVAIGRKGGRATSDRKAASSRENGKKGGRPRALVLHPPTRLTAEEVRTKQQAIVDSRSKK